MRRFYLLSIFLINAWGFTGWCQSNNKILKLIPQVYADSIFITQEMEKGTLLSYKKFRKNKFIPANSQEIKSFHTTMLLGTGTYLYNYLQDSCSRFKPIVVKPNGYFSTRFIVKFMYSEGEILLIRDMPLAKLSKDPLAAERPENYTMTIAFNIPNLQERLRMQNKLVAYFTKGNLVWRMINKNE
ncbi:MAG: hypothetical protein KA138_09490 [Saprospiraceae bacterium]|jgi:hypothetical protein|nr:hypothetical protein [Saprospiraceae bacterium]